MKLGNLFQGIPVLEKCYWDANRRIGKITSDSRAIEPGDLFVACHGSRMDGHDFIGEAIIAKASAIVIEHPVEVLNASRTPLIRVASSAACLAQLLKNFYSNPEQKIKLVGITGTNGKTTTAYLLQQMLREESQAAYLGTLWYDIAGQKVSAPNTTPGSEILIPMMKQMVDQGVKYCVMEVSSHALEQKRVFGLEFELAIFTQLTQDHLDYHKSMEAYFQAKRLFFTSHPRPKQMLLNRDCSFGRRLLDENPGARSYSLETGADYQAMNIEPSFQGSRFIFKSRGREIPFQIRLPMRHNIANVTTVLAALDMLGYDPENFRGILAEIPGIPGRLERVPGPDKFQIFVDYAHTPDAIENVLREAKKLKPKRILTLFGCGGDRDRTKRPLMAKAACEYSDLVLLTSDNPRSEDPEAILDDIKQGVSKHSRDVQILEILDRMEAIEKIVSLAEPGDAIFILGKGHEDYQIIGDRKIPFDDRLVVQDALKRKNRVLS